MAASLASNLAIQLESFAANLPLPVQSLVRTVTSASILRSAAQPESPTPTIDYIYTLLAKYSTISYTTICATLLGIVFVFYKFSMSYYNRGSLDEGWGGRRSPYTASSGRGSIADHYEYLTSDSLLSEPRYPHGAHRQSVASTQGQNDDGPDTLLLRYKHHTYELHFQPYAISDGVLLISDVKQYAAEKLKADPRRLRLLYKGRPLREDHYTAKAYNLKQHSEIMCVISEVETFNGAGSDHSGSGDESSVASNTGARRRRANSTSRPRSTQYYEPTQLPSQSHQHHSASRPNPPAPSGTRSSKESLRAPAMEKQSSKQSSNGHPSPPRDRSPNPPLSYQNQNPPPRPTNHAPVDPNSPLGKVNALASSFHTQWLPKCTQFILSPPADPKTRDLEYNKLSESVLAQIVLKADNIEMLGDSEARASRKQLVNEASEVMKRLDAIGKRAF